MGAPLPDDALLRSLLELLPAGVMVLDVEGRVAFSNPAAAAAWTTPLGNGSSPTLPAGTRWASGAMALPGDWAGHRALRDQVPVLGQALWMTDPGGHSRLVVHSAVPVRGKPGAEGAVVLLQDLTEFKALEIRQAAVLASMGEALLCLDERSRITLVNPAAELLLGHPAARLIGADLAVLADPLVRPTLGTLLTSAANPATLRSRLRRAGGEPLEAEVTASRFECEGQQLVTLLVRDVEHRDRADAEWKLLAKAGELLSSTLDERSVARDVVNLLAGSGRVQAALLDVLGPGGEWNRLAAASAHASQAAWVRALEAQPVPAEGLLTDGGSPGEDAPRLIPVLDADALRRRVPSVTTRLLLERLGVGSALSLPLRARGRLRGSLWLLGGPGALTERELGWTGLLASRVALALDNARLFDRANRAAKETEGLVSVVAHELRNPISTCRMAAALVRRALPGNPDMALRAAQNAERASLRAEQIIQDLLARAPGDGPLLHVQPSALDLELLLPELDALAEGLSHGARWEVSTAGGLPKVRADAGRLLQVLGNLVSNAFRHAPEGGTVRLVVDQERPGTVRFRVLDNGPGVPPELYPTLFQRGARGPGGGSGLGLYLARELVEAMGGQIRAEPPTGRGATFSVTLPAEQGPAHVPSPP